MARMDMTLKPDLLDRFTCTLAAWVETPKPWINVDDGAIDTPQWKNVDEERTTDDQSGKCAVGCSIDCKYIHLPYQMHQGELHTVCTYLCSNQAASRVRQYHPWPNSAGGLPLSRC